MSKMSKDVKETYEQDILALYEELEGEYGLVLAQQIVDEIRKAENKEYLPDYTTAKFLSETIEFFRPKALEAAKSLRRVKSETSHLPDGVESLCVRQAEQDFNHFCGVYLLVKSVYWDFYTRIMTDFENRRFKPRHEIVDAPMNPETATIRKAV